MTYPKQIVIQKRNGKNSHNIRKELRCHFFIFCKMILREKLILYSVIYNHAEKVKEFSSVEKMRSSQSLKD